MKGVEKLVPLLMKEGVKGEVGMFFSTSNPPLSPPFIREGNRFFNSL